MSRLQCAGGLYTAGPGTVGVGLPGSNLAFGVVDVGFSGFRFNAGAPKP